MKILAECREYSELIDALRARVRELNTTNEGVDEIAGLPARYTVKLFAPMAMRSLGRISLGPLLGALGLKLHVVEDAEALARIKKRITARKIERPIEAAAIVVRFSKRYLRKIGRKGGQNLRRYLTQKRRREIGRQLTRSRISKRARS